MYSRPIQFLKPIKKNRGKIIENVFTLIMTEII